MFIRAPIIERVGPDVDVLATLDDGRVVAVRERNVIATAFHPELAGETRFHRLVATMAAEHAEPGEGAGRRHHPTRRAGARRVTEPRADRADEAPGKVRAARLTDLAALGELSRLAPGRDGDGDALARAAGERPADRRVQPVPPAAGRVPAARPAVRLRGASGTSRACCASSARAAATSGRSWSSTRSASGDAGDIRFRLVQHLLRDGAKRGAVALPRRLRRRATTTSSCSCRRGSCATAKRASCTGRRTSRCPAPMDRRGGGRNAASGPSTPLDALRPQPPVRVRRRRSRSSGWRLSASPTGSARAATGASRAARWRPILRFADVEAFVQEAPGGGTDGTQLDGFVQVGVAKEDQPHYLKVLARPDADSSRSLRYRTGRDRAHAATPIGVPPITACSRPCGPTNRRSTGASRRGLPTIATVTLLMKETLVRVAEPRLVPAASADRMHGGHQPA